MRTSALTYLTPSVFSTEPVAHLAFRLPSTVECQVTPKHFKARANPSHDYTLWVLKDETILTLTQKLTTTFGVEVTDLNTNYAWCSASALLTGTSNSIWMCIDTLPAISHTLQEQTDLADEEMQNMLTQIILTSAQENWADFWGSYFGVVRWVDEADSDYTQRIIGEIFRPRVNKKALEKMVDFITNSPTSIYEPHVDLCRLDTPSALLSGPRLQERAVLPDGVYWTYCTFDVVNEKYTTVMRRAIDRSRAAGCHAFYRQSHNFDVDSNQYAEGGYTQTGIITPSDQVYIFYLDDGNTIPPSGYTVIFEPKTRLFLHYLTVVDILFDEIYDYQGKAWHPQISGITFNFDVWAFLSPKDNLTPEDVENPLWCGGEWPLWKLIEFGYKCADTTIWEQPILSMPDKILGFIYDYTRYSGFALLWDNGTTDLYWDDDATPIEWIEAQPQLYWDDSVTLLVWDDGTTPIEWAPNADLVLFDTGVSCYWDDNLTLLTVEDGNF